MLFPPQLALLLALIALLGVCYLWISNRCETLSRDIKRIEESRADLERRVVNEQYKWAHQTSLSRLEAKLAEFQIEMSFPPSSRIVHLDHAVQLAELDPDAAWGRHVVHLSDREPAMLHD
jgi:hypothetical protein